MTTNNSENSTRSISYEILNRIHSTLENLELLSDRITKALDAERNKAEEAMKENSRLKEIIGNGVVVEIQSLAKKLEEADKDNKTLASDFNFEHDRRKELQSKLLSLEAMNGVMVDAFKEIVDSIPASQDGGGLIVEHFDPEGNYIGSENIDPISVIGFMSDVAKKTLLSPAIQQQIKINEAKNTVIEKAIKVRDSKDHQEFIGELFDTLSNLESLESL